MQTVEQYHTLWSSIMARRRLGRCSESRRARAFTHPQSHQLRTALHNGQQQPPKSAFYADMHRGSGNLDGLYG